MPAASAQSASDAANIYFSNINTSNSNLSYNNVNVLLEDRRGFLWVGTSNGLNRYDGTNFHVYTREALGLNSAFIVTLHEGTGGIWIGTDSGVAYYDYLTDRITPFAMKSDTGATINGKATVITEDHQGNVWMGINEQGVFCYDPVNRTLRNYFNRSGKRLPANVRAIYFHPDGRCWLSLYYHNLYTPDWEKETITPVSINGSTTTFAGDNIVDMIGSMHGSVYVASAHLGLCEIDGNDHLRQLIDTIGIDPEGMFLDHLRRLWISSPSGVYRYNTVSGATDRFVSSTNDPFSLSENYVHDVTVSRDGNIWIGSGSHGIDHARASDNNFHKIFLSSPRGNSGAQVTGMTIDGEGNIWCSTMKSGIMKCSKGTRTGARLNVPGLPSETFSIRSHDNRLWVSSLNGIYRIDPSSGKARCYNQFADTPLKESKCYTFYVTSGNDLIVCTTLGMYLYDKANDTFSPLGDLNKQYITDVVEDMRGNLWLATFADGLIHYDPSRQRIIRQYRSNPADANALPSNKLMGVMLDNLGRVWSASFGGGVSMLDEATQTFTNYNGASTSKTSIGDLAYGIVEDERGILWICTDKGLLSLSPATGETHRYTRSDGLLNNDFARSGAYKDSVGNIYICSSDGIIVFNPRLLETTDTEGNVVLTSLQVNGNEMKAGNEGSPLDKSIDLTPEIELSHRCHSIGFDVSDINFNNNDNPVYYMLKGFDLDYNRLPSTGHIEYANLSPGTYTLEFVRRHDDGTTETVHPPLTIKIAQVFYKTPLAIAIYILIASASVLWIAYRYYRRQIDNEHHRAEQERREQEQNAYNEKMALFSSIASRLRSPLALIRNPLKNILQNKRNSGELIDDLMIISNGADRLSEILNDFSNPPEEDPPMPKPAADGGAPATNAKPEEGKNHVILLTERGDIRQITDSDAEFMQSLDAIVMENIGDSDFGNEELAARLCMSKSTLIRRTRQVLGTTPNDYILHKRLSIAERMLNNPNCRINEICYSIGFNTPSYFTKCFRKAYGMSPSEYKERNASYNSDANDAADCKDNTAADGKDAKIIQPENNFSNDGIDSNDNNGE